MAADANPGALSPLDRGTVGAVIDAVRHMPRNLEWRLKSERTLSIADAEATFYTGSFPEAAFVDHTYRTERPVVAELLSTVDPEDVVWDVGANYGFYACLVGEKLRGGDVVAFEPLDRNVRRLGRNLSLSEVDATVRQIALGDESATVEFEPPTFTNTFRGVARIAPEADDDAIDVQIRAGDRLVRREDLPAPSVVKIDVEGAEALVLDGMDHVLSNGCRAVFCELHPGLMDDYDTTVGDVTDTLRDHGFAVRPIQRRGEVRHVKAIREA